MVVAPAASAVAVAVVVSNVVGGGGEQLRELHHLRGEELQAEYREAEPLQRAALTAPDQEHDICRLGGFDCWE